MARPSSRHLPSVTTATVETWIAAAAVGCRAGHEADRYVPLRYRSIYRPSQKLPFTTGGFGSTSDRRRVGCSRRSPIGQLRSAGGLDRPPVSGRSWFTLGLTGGQTDRQRKLSHFGPGLGGSSDLESARVISLAPRQKRFSAQGRCGGAGPQSVDPSGAGRTWGPF